LGRPLLETFPFLRNEWLKECLQKIRWKSLACCREISLSFSEGKKVARVKDIHKALGQKDWGKDMTFTMLREG
jgi:hypothetical protein